MGLPDGIDLDMTYLLAAPAGRRVIEEAGAATPALREAVEALEDRGEVTDHLLDTIVADETGAALRSLVKNRPVETVRRILLGSFDERHPPRPVVRRALALACATGDEELFAVAEDQLEGLAIDTVDRAMAAAAQRGSSRLAMRLAEHLLARTA